MARIIPDNPAFTTVSEAQVWEQLRDGLPDDAVVLANVRLTTEEQDYEADLVVLLPDFGVLVLEVKGGSVAYGPEGWTLTSDGETRKIHPVDQVRDGKYALRAYVEADPTWGSRGRVAWAHGVVAPYSSFPQDFSLPDLPRWALHARGDLEHLPTRVRENAWRMDQGHRTLMAEDVEAIAEILTGRLHTSYDVNAQAEERAAAADRLTAEQAMILGVTRLLNRVEVRGGAGSGKTVLALQQAKELSRGRHGRKPQRVAVLCYSIGLAEHLKRKVASWHRKDRPAFVGTFHELGMEWGAPDGDRADSEFWEERLPQLMAGLADEVAVGKRFDAIVVDEAQDFADSWWTPLLKALKDEETGGLYVFSDENQRIFGRFGRPPVHLVPLVLDHCLRNTREIHEAFNPLAPSRMHARGGHGPDVTFVPATVDTATEVADDEVVRLLDEEGWEPGRVALITTGHRHFSQVDLTEQLGQSGYWASYFDGEEVFYGHVLGCKGLERSAVVLCLNEDGTRDRARERLYVGMSRATDRLVVVGDPEMVRRVGGREVARRLGIDRLQPQTALDR